MGKRAVAYVGEFRDPETITRQHMEIFGRPAGPNLGKFRK